MLKYLKEIGTGLGVTLEMENSYGLTPIVYAMMNHKVYTFIYLFSKIKAKFPAERAEWTTTQLVKQGSSETSIIQLLLHDEVLGDKVAEAALTASVEFSNPYVLKAVLKHRYYLN